MAPSTSPGAVDISALATKAEIPTPATSTPPAVADTGTKGVTSNQFAMPDHTHASKARKDRLQTATNGTLTWTYSTAFGAGVVPRISAIAETTGGTSDIYNVQIVGTPTNTSCQILCNRVQQSVAAVLGLTVLSVPASPGVTWVHLLALEP